MRTIRGIKMKYFFILQGIVLNDNIHKRDMQSLTYVVSKSLLTLRRSTGLIAVQK